MVLLLGASGSGKTTLLSALGSILTPASGSIRVGDVDVVELSGKALTEYRRRHIGIVFQSFNLIPSLTARENVEMPLRDAGVRGRKAKARASELLAPVDLSDRAPHRPPDLSGGQTQPGGHRPGAGVRPAAAAGRRAHRPPRLHPGGGSAVAAAGAGLARPVRHHRHARRAAPAPRRPGRGADA